MIQDSSALVAILANEEDGESLSLILDGPEVVRLSAASYLETSIVIDHYRDPALRAMLDDMILDSEIVIEPVTPELARVARQAYRYYGRGCGHAANLNFGDCFSYALARVMREPILFKGDDFIHTDLRSAASNS